ncbi:bifunctional DNA-formamidopyrimidine glycosylase/DNA-(apurinic or apyrimidinic site) lyase [Rhodococcus aerolatus]
MPELPEVEVVRLGLDEHLVGRAVAGVEVRHPRAVRRHAAGGDDLAGRLTGARVTAARRRGKFLWLDLAGESVDRTALVVHLGMSGQMRVQPVGAPDETHLRIRLALADEPGHEPGTELRFVDQRTFGGWALEPLVEVDGTTLPAAVAHIARDPLDDRFDVHATVRALRRRRTELKRALLDQTLVSGIGNIYADEALWRAQLHGRRPTHRVTPAEGRRVLATAAEVMMEALAQGGTSFDALYVNVNGASGYFDRRLAAYGQAGRPCPRCGTPIVKEVFTNRSSAFCPVCQKPPRVRRT